MKLSNALLALSLASSLVACSHRPKRPHFTPKPKGQTSPTTLTSEAVPEVSAPAVEAKAEPIVNIEAKAEEAVLPVVEEKKDEAKKDEVPAVTDCYPIDLGIWEGTTKDVNGTDYIATFLDAECKILENLTGDEDGDAPDSEQEAPQPCD